MAGQRIDIMELRTLIALKLKKFSNRKVALLLKINRKTVDGYIKRFTELGIKRKPSDVYLDVGFEDLSHFSFAFKKHFGYNPSRITLSKE